MTPDPASASATAIERIRWFNDVGVADVPAVEAIAFVAAMPAIAALEHAPPGRGTAGRSHAVA